MSIRRILSTATAVIASVALAIPSAGAQASAPAAPARAEATSCQIAKPTRVAPPVGRILAPRTGQRVALHQPLRGTVRRLGSNTLWVIVRPHANHLCYPQAGPARVTRRGTWTATAWVGLPGNHGETFDLLIVAADAEATAWLRRYIRQGVRSGSYPGLRTLPTGVRVLHVVTVRRI
jgi:hypothetical protein